MKNLIKKITSFLPYKYLRFTGKYFTINAVFFRYAKLEDRQYIVNDDEYAFRFYDMESRLGNKIMTGFIKQAMTYVTPGKMQREYILDAGKCFLDPKYGWAIPYRTNQLIKDSVTYNHFLEQYYPSFMRYKLLNEKKVQKLGTAISIRMIDGSERNYWHFLSDMLGIVVLADKYGFPKDTPFVITRKLADQPFFEQVMEFSSDLKSRNWIIQDKQYILVEKLFLCQKMPNQKDQFEGLLELLKIPDADKTASRRVFVRRSAKRIRFISNHEAVEEIARKHGFEIIECDDLSFKEQVKLFGEASYVIGIHGAGLTNIVWRKNAPTNVMELFPEDYVHPGYFWLAKSFGKSYTGLTGSKVRKDSSFYIEPDEFEKNLIRFLASCQ